ncbi:SNF2 family N-terminal domain-containing protein [Epithele typhae]|uniref:SNF2 family N-terminal domain-containing protein n=1 Tax=Epithele typhae TaxID=378194 RepID=UPI0020072F05|nr:SNF2 family N-terminal domain-containing protein [Epithele typhae]KAH9929517.1 SNF2 family N-terminal domain-containing protein [Epithele typhae]
MSLGPEAAAARKAALEQLKFKKVQKKQGTSLSNLAAPSSPSWTSSGAIANTAVPAPTQSRDATATSRYFPPPPSSSAKILVPNSSPLRTDPQDAPVATASAWDLFKDDVPGLSQSNSPTRPGSLASDPLAMSSGFRVPNGVSSASSTRPSSSSSRKMSQMDDAEDGDRPRKRLNTGPTTSRDPIDFLSPASPEVQTSANRRHAGTPSLSSMSLSSDESMVDPRESVNGTSRTRIIRRAAVPPSTASQPSPSSKTTPDDDPRFTTFRLTHIEREPSDVRAAWRVAGGDESKASALLKNPYWKPPVETPPPKERDSVAETGRVKEVVEANKAQRLAVREKGKKSMIYRNRTLDGKPVGDAVPETPPASKAPLMVVDSPMSPELMRPRKRLKRKVVTSDSEDGYEDSDASSDIHERASLDQQRALDYFNETSAEGLQELTGCTPEQATKIIELRPYVSIEDLNSKLSQGKKKAGPAGVSSRMFEDSAAIFKGYHKVDSILEDCEKIGTSLRTEIASWTHSKGKEREGSRASSVLDNDGVISLTHIEGSLDKPKYYMNNPPALLQEGVLLKDYQMIGVNWLSLLYQKSLSCILADEMGLGKTVQVISFFAHLKERGRNGPHLVIVPSSTLENWCREFQKFVGDGITVETYYADKNERPRLRERLNDTVATQKTGGWNVLVTTYQLATGDDHDRKFFRKMDWDTCVYDEGHMLKNFQSQRYQALLRYKCRWRLLLTGTPLQNNLQELVSLMNFILPDHFADSFDSLRAVFKTKGDSKVTLLAQQRVSRAKKMMTPFVLRRRKDQVLSDLPKKTERIEWCDMTSLQKSIYNEALLRSRKTVFDLEENSNSAETSDAAANGRGKPAKKTRAKLGPRTRSSSHPMLFRRRFSEETLASMARMLLKEPDFKKRGAIYDYVKEDLEVMSDAELQEYCKTYKSLRRFVQDEDCYLEAGKIKVLMNLLEQYKNEGRRILIFSQHIVQFTQLLDILEKIFELKKIKYTLLTGTTPVDVRQSLVDEFNEDESISVFLLSTKAGGMGINLTAASVVIMYDQDFNPHNDKQAQDRAYRIGQKRDVDVIKLITKGSIEEDMLALGQMKLALDEAVAGEEGERVEREVQMSLMSAVRKKLTTDGDVDMKDCAATSATATPAAA